MSQTLLTVPVGPVHHSAGSDSAAITLVEYGDYQCSYCAEAFRIVGQLQWLFGDDLRFVFRNMPLRPSPPARGGGS